MKVKVAEASGVVLDYMVAMALGHNIVWDGIAYWISDLNTSKLIGSKWRVCGKPCGWSPSTHGGDGMPIIEREEISVEYGRAEFLSPWIAYKLGHPNEDNPQGGPTPLIAAMRCLVTSRLGEEVEVPAELFLEKHQ